MEPTTALVDVGGGAVGQLPSVRSLETLHNALSLRQLDEFLERVVSTNYRPTQSLTSSLQTISQASNNNGGISSRYGDPPSNGERAGSLDSTICCDDSGGNEEPSPPLGSKPCRGGFSPSSSNSCSNSCCFMEMKDGQLSLYTEPIIVRRHSPSSQHHLPSAPPLDSLEGSGVGAVYSGYSGPPSFVSSAPSSPLFTSGEPSTEFSIARPILTGQIVGSVTNLYQGESSDADGSGSGGGGSGRENTGGDKPYSFGWENM